MADETLPYLAIRNWAKFQSVTDKHGKSLEGRRRTYILDYCEKETDSLYASLSPTARYLIDGCRRLRGKHGCNVKNDFMWILRQLDVYPTERGRCTHALQALVRRGFLIPTNEQFSVPPKPETPIPNTDINTHTPLSSVLGDLPDIDRRDQPQDGSPVEFPKSNTQDSLRDDRSSEDNTNPKPKSNTIRTPIDTHRLIDNNAGLTSLVWSQHTGDDPPPRFLKDLLGETPTKKEAEELLTRTEDSVDTILATVKWGLEVSNHWFKTQRGIVRNYTDLANAYPTMSEQYQNYISKGAKK